MKKVFLAFLQGLFNLANTVGLYKAYDKSIEHTNSQYPSALADDTTDTQRLSRWVYHPVEGTQGTDVIFLLM